MDLYQTIIGPFAEFDFMRYALASVVFLALSAAPVGVFLVMRRMSLVGDALSHAVLPGAAIGYMFAGLSLPAMSLGGFAAGMLMALLAGLVSRFTNLKEDANFAAFYLSSLAVGVILVSKNGSNIDLLHLLFGSVLAVDLPALQLVAAVAAITVLTLAVIYRPLVLESIDPLFLKAVGGRGGLWHLLFGSVLAVDLPALTLVALVASITLVALAVIYRPLLLESIDPLFLQAVGGKGGVWHSLFLVLVVMNLVAGFQALGTLMSVGLMMLPAISARLWCKTMGSLMLLAVLLALACGVGGLLFSYYVEIPSGPAIILCCGGVYLLSLLIGWEGGLLPKWLRRHKHHTA